MNPRGERDPFGTASPTDDLAGCDPARTPSPPAVASKKFGTVEYRRCRIFSKLEVQSIAEMATAVAELERLTDITMLLNAPPIRLTDSGITSFCMPVWMQSVGRNHTALDQPHVATRERACLERPVQDGVPH